VIVLDTNVLSALIPEEPDTAVVDWLNGIDMAEVWITAVTVFEIRLGLSLMAQGRRRRFLEAAFDGVLNDDFRGRVLPFDEASALEAGVLSAERRKQGFTDDLRDIQIAGIARAHGAAVATRNVRHFVDLGPVLINPWSTNVE
jgi:predicted nucleic acid-binding protein